ncbi:MAG: LexA repressor [candidate division BRC1 bacterium ADurb.BinA292]|nr:MAG: LexA repressor [candidate division BRC1 bacterium ADurb.BinA292]
MYLTRRQREMLNVIEQFIEENRYSPTLEEIADQLGLSSLATVHKHLQNLEQKGLIRRQWNHSRAIEVTSKARVRGNGLPLMGEVAAGLPIEAIENPEYIDVPRELVGRRESFVLRVRGDSMIDDGIRDGDLLVVESRRTALPGQTVVALIDGAEATVKRFYPEGEIVRLQPANETMSPLRYPAARVRIQGIVVGLMRKY